MTKHLFPMNTEHVLGSVGLFLLIVVGKLADRGYGPQQTFAGRVSGCMARRAIDAIAVLGWLVARLPDAAVLPPPSSACDAGNGWRPRLTRIRIEKIAMNRRTAAVAAKETTPTRVLRGCSATKLRAAACAAATDAPSTAYRCRPSSSPWVNIRP